MPLNKETKTNLILFTISTANIASTGIFVTLGKVNNMYLFNAILFTYTLLIRNLTIFDKWTIMTPNELEGRFKWRYMLPYKILPIL